MKKNKSKKRSFLNSIRLVKRSSISQSRAWSIRGVAFLLAFGMGALFIAALGHNPVEVYKDIVRGALGSNTLLKETIKFSVQLLILSIAVSFAFKMRFWNIGAEGQLLFGAIAAGYFAYFKCDTMAHVPLIICMFAASALAGGISGLLPAIVKSKWDANETLFTLMLNYIAIGFIKYLESGPWKRADSAFPKMAMLSTNARLTPVCGIYWGWIFALVLVVAAYLYFTKTKQGFEIAVVGASERTAKYAGIRVSRVLCRTIFIGGALAGIAGFFKVAGVDYTLSEFTGGGMGYTAIMVAWLAKMNPFAMIIVSIFIGILTRGTNKIQTTFNIPASAADILIGIILLFMLSCELFVDYKLCYGDSNDD